VKNNKQIKDEYISIRCTAEVKDYLNALADEYDRSISGQVMYMLKQTDVPLAKLMQKTVRSDVPNQKKAELGQDPF